MSIEFHTFIGEIDGGNCPLNGGVPAPSHLFPGASLNGTIMKKGISYKSGQRLGECIYLHDTKMVGKERHAIFICRCEKGFEARISHVKSKAIRSCGCTSKSVKHRMTGHPMFRRWRLIKERCYSENREIYKRYGARGITMCDEWRNDFMAFYDYMINLPNYDLSLTIDRINGKIGYVPGNVRWATRQVQAANRLLNKNSKSGYTGVYYIDSIKKYKSQIKARGIYYYLGCYSDIKGAVNARNEFITESGFSEFNIQEYDI